MTSHCCALTCPRCREEGWDAALEEAAELAEPKADCAYHYEARDALNRAAASIRALIQQPPERLYTLEEVERALLVMQPGSRWGWLEFRAALEGK